MCPAASRCTELAFAGDLLACRALRNVLVDNKEQEIYMNIEERPGQPFEAMLLVDYDQDNAGGSNRYNS